MKPLSPFSLTILILLTAMVCATYAVVQKAMPPDTLEKMLLLIVGGALGAMQVGAMPGSRQATTIPAPPMIKEKDLDR